MTGSAGASGADGLPGTNGPAGPGVTWVQVSGTTQQAAPNTGYLANNASEVVVTLPVSASLAVGDIIQLSGVGAGGWKVAQNAGQSIVFTKEIYGALGPAWLGRDSDRNWQAVASSADGTKLAAAEIGGQIYTSFQPIATTTGTAGFIRGDQNEAVALQYIGSDTFSVIGHEGALTVN